MPRSLRALATARREVAPLACSSVRRGKKLGGFRAGAKLTAKARQKGANAGEGSGGCSRAPGPDCRREGRPAHPLGRISLHAARPLGGGERRGRTDPPGRSSAVPAHDASLARTLATCVGCHRPPLGVGTPRRVSSSAAARTLSAATCAKTLASSLARSSAAWALMSLRSRCPPRTTPRALAACSAALVRSPIRRRSFSARAA